jgi:hypothetical protein
LRRTRPFSGAAGRCGFDKDRRRRELEIRGRLCRPRGDGQHHQAEIGMSASEADQNPGVATGQEDCQFDPDVLAKLKPPTGPVDLKGLPIGTIIKRYTVPFGDILIACNVVEMLGIRRYAEKLFPTRANVSVGIHLALASALYMIHPDGLCNLGEQLCAPPAAEVVFGDIPETALDEESFFESMEALDDEIGWEDLLEAVSMNVKHLFFGSVLTFYYDSSNSVAVSSYLAQSALDDNGDAKSLEFNSDDISYSLFTDGILGIPLWFEAYTEKWHVSNNKMREFECLQRVAGYSGHKINDQYWCFDIGEFNESLARALIMEKTAFITSLEICDAQSLVDNALDKLAVIENCKRNMKLKENKNENNCILGFPQVGKLFGHEMKIVVTLDPALKRTKINLLEKTINVFSDYIAVCQENVHSGKTGWTTEEEVRRQIADYCKNIGMAWLNDVFDISFTVIANGLEMHANVNQTFVDQQKKYLGVKVLLCSNKEKPDGEIVDIFSERWRAEVTLKDFKSMGSLHATDKNMMAHATAKYFAVIGRRILKQKMKDAGYDISVDKLFAQVGKIKCEAIVKVGKGHKKVTEYYVDDVQNNLQHSIFEAFGYEIKDGNVLLPGQKPLDVPGLRKRRGARRKSDWLPFLESLEPRPWKRVVKKLKEEKNAMASNEEFGVQYDIEG